MNMIPNYFLLSFFLLAFQSCQDTGAIVSEIVISDVSNPHMIQLKTSPNNALENFMSETPTGLILEVSGTLDGAVQIVIPCNHDTLFLEAGVVNARSSKENYQGGDCTIRFIPVDCQSGELRLKYSYPKL